MKHDAPGATDARAAVAVRFEAFVLEFQDMVYATAVRLLGNPTEAEDVAQTVFLKAFERFDQIGTSPTAAGWLKTVTTNTCLNYLSRYRNRWRFFSELGRDDAASVDARTSGPQDPPSPLHGYGEASPRTPGLQDPRTPGPQDPRTPGPQDPRTPGLQDPRTPGPQDPRTPGLQDSVLDLALRRLPPHQRVPIVLFHFDDLSYQQIAERLGVSVGKVKTDIHRGRETLRAALLAVAPEQRAR